MEVKAEGSLSYDLDSRNSLESKSKEELIRVIENLLCENEILNAKLALYDRGSEISSPSLSPVTPLHSPHPQESTHEKALLDLGSLGSNSIQFLQAADSSVGVEADTSSAQVRNNYLQLERGANAFRAPDVMFYKSLFSKSNFILDYDADSPQFR